MAPSCMLPFGHHFQVPPDQGGRTGCILLLRTWHMMMTYWCIAGWWCDELHSSHPADSPTCPLLVAPCGVERSDPQDYLLTAKSCRRDCRLVKGTWAREKSLPQSAGSWWGAQVNLLPWKQKCCWYPRSLCIVFHNNRGLITACSLITSPKCFPPRQ